jgi:cell filamentation protein, protein adenylyltransferase
MKSTPTSSHRTFEQTHPWLRFRIDLSNAPPRFWMLLGEVRSKIEHIAGSPLKPETAERMHSLFLAKGVHATTAIEGSTLTEEQAKQIIEGKLVLPPSQQYLAVEVRNIVSACNRIFDDLQKGAARTLEAQTIKEFNLQVLANLKVDEDVIPGEVRGHSVVVARYRGAPPEDCEYLLQKFCDWLNGPEFTAPSPEMKMPFAVLKAVVAHLYLAWIHPFGDGNGRTARLIELQILLAAGIPTPAAHLLSNHYNQTRAEYYRQLDKASSTGGEILPFLLYAVEGFADGLRSQLGLIRKQQFEDRWEQFVYESFGSAITPAMRRRRQLVISISKANRPVPRQELNILTPEVAILYGGKGARTLTRDVNEVLKMDLIYETADGYLPRWERIRAFLPPQMESN